MPGGSNQTAILLDAPRGATITVISMGGLSAAWTGQSTNESGGLSVAWRDPPEILSLPGYTAPATSKAGSPATPGDRERALFASDEGRDPEPELPQTPRR